MSLPCGQQIGPNDGEFWKQLSMKIHSQRIPFLGGLALTHRCNLSCIHCYAREDHPDLAEFELNTAQWKKIITEAKDAGCLFLLLTGGEPMLRGDFSEIYRFAKQNGFLVTVFTNGTLVTDKIAGLFREFPPKLVEISLYGASAEAHDRITGVPGSFDRARRGIETLIGLGVNVGLKSVLMKWNADEFPALNRLAHSYGAKFRVDPAIFPTLAGDRSPLDLRVSPELAVANEFSDPGRAGEWRKFLDQFRGIRSPENLYVCGAGINSFYIDPQGFVFPCLMVRKVKFSLLSGSFQEGWDQAFSTFRNQVPDADLPCGNCEQKLVCGYCPGFFEMENSDERVHSDYLCAMGKIRYERINSETMGV